MQIKKEHVKEKILQSALNEFLICGFENASLRNIVKNANTTTGNFYNYFENKEALFDALVTPSFMIFKWLMSHQSAYEQLQFLWETKDLFLIRKQLLSYFELWVPKVNDGFILLFKHSENTRYAFFKDAFIDHLSDYFTAHVKGQNSDYAFPQMGHILAKQTIDGFIDILQMHLEPSYKYKLMVEHILVIVMGTLHIL